MQLLIDANTALLADVGLPMLALHFPLLVLLLLPIILIEIAVAKRSLAKPLPQGFKSAIAWANVLSTLLGIPLAWFGLVLLEFGAEAAFYAVHGDFSPDSNFPERHKHIFDLLMVVCSAPWLLPVDGPQFAWLPSAATLVLLVPYYFVSVWVEGWIMRRIWKSREKAEVMAASRRANAASYALLAAATIMWLIVTARKYGWP
jgi:hypothetical protein